MRKLLILLCASSALAFGSTCPDVNLREAKIGGDAISGSVQLRHRPLKKASVRLYLGKKLLWIGATDSNGRFEVDHLAHDNYRLVVSGWGSAEIELKPELDLTGLHQRPSYSLLLIDQECIAAIEVVN
jgi:hypothetical protein